MWTDSVSAFNGHTFHILHDSRYRHDPVVADVVDDYTGETINLELDLNVHSEMVSIAATVAVMVELFHKKVTMYWRTEDFDLLGTLHLIDWYLLEQIPHMREFPEIAVYITKQLMPFRGQVLHEVHCMFGRRPDMLKLYMDHENVRRGIPTGAMTIRSVITQIQHGRYLADGKTRVPISQLVRHIFPLQKDVQGLIDTTLGKTIALQDATPSYGMTSPPSVAYPGRSLF